MLFCKVDALSPCGFDEEDLSCSMEPTTACSRFKVREGICSLEDDIVDVDPTFVPEEEHTGGGEDTVLEVLDDCTSSDGQVVLQEELPCSSSCSSSSTSDEDGRKIRSNSGAKMYLQKSTRISSKSVSRLFFWTTDCPEADTEQEEEEELVGTGRWCWSPTSTSTATAPSRSCDF